MQQIDISNSLYEQIKSDYKETLLILKKLKEGGKIDYSLKESDG